MRRTLAVFGLGVVLVLGSSPGGAGGPSDHGNHGGPPGHHGWQNPSHRSHYRYDGWGGWGGVSLGYYSGGPSWSPLYSSPFSPYSYAYPPAYWPYSFGNSSYLGPIVLPAETFFGPAAAQRFFGGGVPYRPNANVIVAPNAGVPAAVPDGVPAGGPVEAERADEPPPNAEAMSLSRHFLGLGNTYFASQRYSSAYQRYVQAINAAPRWSEPYLYQAVALVALGRYSTAARTLRRAAALEGELSQSAFRLGTLYGNNGLAKAAHLDALAQAANERPDDGDLLFVVGCLLHFDGQAERAKPFFRRAAQLAGNDSEHLRSFLK